MTKPIHIQMSNTCQYFVCEHVPKVGDRFTMLHRLRSTIMNYEKDMCSDCVNSVLVILHWATSSDMNVALAEVTEVHDSYLAVQHQWKYTV